MTDVAVVVGNYEGEAVLPECLASIRLQTVEPAEVIVVDASSVDASVTIAAEAGATVVHAPNLGLGYLYNRGVAATEAEYVLLLNNDVALEPDCVDLLAAALDADALRFAADPTQLDWSGETVIHARTTLGRGRLWHEFIPGLHIDPNVPADTVSPTLCANGAAMLVRRSMFIELGGFDETFFMEWEDLDLCWRAWVLGWASVYVPQAALRHSVGASTTGRLVLRRQASSHHNLMRWSLKCLPASIATRVVVGELIRLPKHPRAAVSGLAYVVRELPQIIRLRSELAVNQAQWENTTEAFMAAG